MAILSNRGNHDPASRVNYTAERGGGGERGGEREGEGEGERERVRVRETEREGERGRDREGQVDVKEKGALQQKGASGEN